MSAHEPTVRIVPDDDARRVEVLIDDTPFTAYRYDDSPVLSKPVLSPLRTAAGTVLTRGYPLDPRAGERADHPHHVGHWFAYGVDPGVNGVNFWTVSDEIPEEEATEKGRIRHRRVERAAGGAGSGELAVVTDWERGDGHRILRERTRFRFHAAVESRAIDRVSTLRAIDDPVRFPDDKEGMFAIRVAKGLEHPADDPIAVVAEDGADRTVEVAGDEGRTGEYLSSEGITGTDVWGTRAEWMRLSGTVDGETASITVMDHPDNVGHPTHWHARPYGLFAANPLGRAVFGDGGERMDFRLDAGEATTFRYRIAIDSGVPAPSDLNDRYERFVAATREVRRED